MRSDVVAYLRQPDIQGFTEVGSENCTVQKIVDKKEILRTVSNTGIYCSGGKVGTVYLV
jgi:hypothetical protein